VFVDDLNMPAKEEYGAQPPIEILRQWMDHAGWYFRDENTFRELVEIQFIGAMAPPGGGRTQISQRYVRHFNLVSESLFEPLSLTCVDAEPLLCLLADQLRTIQQRVAQPDI
jgi:dynein heavy chain